MWIPEGFGHGFLVLSDGAEVLYKTTDYWYPDHERCIRWDDPDLGVAWPIQDAAPVVSAKDAAGTPLREAALFDRVEVPG
jgi:dTDP-4-dehydrorhamnose 3,5-epimerase